MGKGDSDPNKQKEQPRSRRAERRAAKRREVQAEEKKAKQTATTEQWNHRLIIGAVLAVVIVAVGFIVFGWYQTQIRPLGKTVLRVEETKYSLAHLERRMELELDSGFRFSRGSGSALLNLPDFMIGQLEGEASLLAGIEQLDLEITDEDVAAEIRSRGGLADDVEPVVFADEVRDQVSRSGLKQNEYDLMIRAFVAERKALDYFTFLGVREEAQVLGRLIVVEEEDDALAAIERIEAGEDFIAVAEEVSLTPSNIELDWFHRGEKPSVFEEVEDFFFTADDGERSDLIESLGFYYVVELLERDDARELTEDQRASVASRELGDWLSDVRDSLDIERDLSQDDAFLALDDIL